MVAMDVKAAFEAVVVIVRVPSHLSFSMFVVISVAAFLSGFVFAGVLLGAIVGVLCSVFVLDHECLHHLEHFLLCCVGHGSICANGIRFMWDLDGFDCH